MIGFIFQVLVLFVAGIVLLHPKFKFAPPNLIPDYALGPIFFYSKAPYLDPA